ncbi:toll-like receptor 21 [Salarias fasciatus]|uniref:Toll-like receptor 13 n=1 Tax=Salarias fasciatus TaxID=181472 RepID=A0A672FYB3_SALFA|nr:toll-like receptor 13 [Salarias fasciatus]
MATSIHRLLTAAVVLGTAALISTYSFHNCIETSKDGQRKAFQCVHRHNKTMSAFVDDLPTTTINLTIGVTPVTHIPRDSFVSLPHLQDLRLDRNNLSDIDYLAFHELHELKSLNLSLNNISQLNPDVFQDLSNLTFLSLTNNQLKQLPETIFSTVLELNTLIMRQNLLTNFSAIATSVSHLRNLRILDLCINNLTSLTHTEVTLPKSLTTLYVCRNNLLTLGCKWSFLASIQVLDLSYNPHLPTKAFAGVDLGNINYLRLRSTNVQIVEFLNLSNIRPEHIDFSGTGINNTDKLKDLCKTMQRKKVKYLNKLILGNNGIKTLSNYTLSQCPNIITLDLSRNEFKPTNCLSFLTGQTHIQSFHAEHNVIRSLPSCKVPNMVQFSNLRDLSYRYNRILLVNKYAFYHTPNLQTLKLNINTIAYLDNLALKNLKRLETLRLDNNLLTDLFAKTFEDLSNLKLLNLRNNRISVIFNRTFHSLGKLTTLDLGGNKITHFQPAGFDGLKNLSKLYLDGNNLKEIDPSHYFVFQDRLTVLDLENNQIQFHPGSPRSPFRNLSKLRDLKLSRQQPYGIAVLPDTLFQGLHSLRSLYLTDNKIVHIYPKTFDDLTGLQFLTLDDCCAGVTQLQPGVFKNLRNLTKLTVENMGMQNFSKDVFGNLTQLRTLQLNRNVMQSIPVDALESLPNLQYLDIRDIPLSCTCLNRLLQNYTLTNPRIQVVYLSTLPCLHDVTQKFYKFDGTVCFIDLGEYLFFCTAAVIFLFTVIPLLYVKLYWKMKYSYYVFCAWFSDQWRSLRDEKEKCKYDAFVSYNSSDEQWVMEQLLPNLEGNGSSFKLCLHHRDFELGRAIVDNIVSAVYSSRKTICVVSRSFLQSEWCSLEMQLASYRLFDEHRDVLLLVFLEKISDRQLSSYHRMRKVMLKKTYVQWPGSDCTDQEQAQDLFWNQLRRAMRTGSRLEREEMDQSAAPSKV